MKIGYARVSTEEQRLDRQGDALKAAGCEKVFLEKAPGAKEDRPGLAKILSMLREGDQVTVVKLDRISRSTKHLIELSQQFDEMGVDFVSLGDAIDTTTPMGRFFFRIMVSIAELERDMIAERTKDGLETARARGHRGGRPKVDPGSLERAIKMHASDQFTIKKNRRDNRRQQERALPSFMNCTDSRHIQFVGFLSCLCSRASSTFAIKPDRRRP